MLLSDGAAIKRFALFRYRPAIPVDNVMKALACSREDWTKLTAPLGLSFLGPKKEELDCKTSMAALPLSGKAAT